jgi:hypothetical protein
MEKSKRTGSDCSLKRTDVQWISAVLAVARALWPVKTAQNLAHKTHVTERAAAFWLAGERDISLDAARSLLRSEDGYDFLVALMGDSDARWWVRTKLRRDHGDLKRQIMAQRKRLEELEARSNSADLGID